MVDDATSGGVVEESVFVVDNETASNRTQVEQTKVSLCLDAFYVRVCQYIVSPLTGVSSIG